MCHYVVGSLAKMRQRCSACYSQIQLKFDECCFLKRWQIHVFLAMSLWASLLRFFNHIFKMIMSDFEWDRLRFHEYWVAMTPGFTTGQGCFGSKKKFLMRPPAVRGSLPSLDLFCWALIFLCGWCPSHLRYPLATGQVFSRFLNEHVASHIFWLYGTYVARSHAGREWLAQAAAQQDAAGFASQPSCSKSRAFLYAMQSVPWSSLNWLAVSLESCFRCGSNWRSSTFHSSWLRLLMQVRNHVDVW